MTAQDITALVEPAHSADLTWNHRPAPYRLESNVVSLFEERAASQGGRLAVSDPYGDLTYSQLNQRANRLAHLLSSQGLVAGTIVGVCLPRSSDMVAGMMAILKAGGAYLPIDPDTPRDRILHALREAGAGLVLTQFLGTSPFSGTHVRTVCVDNAELLSEFPDTNLSTQPLQTDLAYVIYTSGSTGLPKGVRISHRSLLNFVLWNQHEFDIRPEDRWAQSSSPGFDACVWEIWPALVSGASVHIVEESTKLLPERLRPWLVCRQVTIAFFTPTLVKLLIGECWPQDCALRILFVGGERLTVRPPKPLPFRLINAYGPTEATVVSTWGDVAQFDPQAAMPDIGRPIFNCQIHIVDQRCQPVPTGVSGELCVAGEGVALGYVRERPTEPSFIPNPFGEGRLYRTGDMARYLDDGRIEYLGRADRQIKLRGYRIELGEIQAVLEERAEIFQAAVVFIPNPGGGTIRAYVVPRGEALDTQHLRQALSCKLPDYMLPSQIVSLSSLPLLQSGKVDSQKLAELVEPFPAQAFSAPQTALEADLAGVWGKLLGASNLGIHDNLFERGANSLIIARAAAECGKLGHAFAVRDVYRAQTIYELARFAANPRLALAPPVAREDDVWPLTPMQCWFFSQNFACPSHWNAAMLFRTPKPLDEDALRTAVENVVRRHEALRLQFHQSGRDWDQSAGSSVGEVFSAIDLSGMPDSRQKQELLIRCTALHSSFTLGRGPLVRFAWFDLGPQGGRLFIVAHHLICDAWSLRIIIDDLTSLLLSGKAADPVPIGVREAASRLTSTEAIAQAVSERAHWSPREVGQLPVDFPGGEATMSSMRFLGTELCADETQLLLRVAQQRYRCGIDTVLLSCAAYCLGQWQRHPRLAITVVEHGRGNSCEGIDLSRTVGWFVVHNNVFVEIAGDTTPPESVARVAEQLDRIPNEGRGYGVLKYIHNPAHDESVLLQPEPNLFFNYLGNQDDFFTNGLFARAEEPTGGGMHPASKWPFRLGMFCGIRGERVHAGWFFSKNIHRKETIEVLNDRFREVLMELLKN